MDAVCSVASEEIRMDAWGLDVVLSASQKGLGAPPGLSIVAASQAAMKVGHFHFLSFKSTSSFPSGCCTTFITCDFLLRQLEKVSTLFTHPICMLNH